MMRSSSCLVALSLICFVPLYAQCDINVALRRVDDGNVVFIVTSTGMGFVAPYRYMELVIKGKNSETYGQVTVMGNEMFSSTISGCEDEYVVALPYDTAKYDIYFSTRPCFDFQINFEYFTQCDMAEADVDYNFTFLEPTPSNPNGVIIDFNDETQIHELKWAYDSIRLDSRDNFDICPCQSWQVAYSKRSEDVFEDPDVKIVAEPPCPERHSSFTTLTYNMTQESFPIGQWVWVSVMEHGYSFYGDDITGYLPGMKLCSRVASVHPPTFTPDPLMFFSDTANLSVSWDESGFNTAVCGSKQNVELCYAQNSSFVVYKDAVKNGEPFSVQFDKNFADYEFLLATGPASYSDKDLRQLSVLDCRYLSNSDKWEVSVTRDTCMSWAVSINFKWEGECNGLISHSEVKVVFDAFRAENFSEVTELHGETIATLPYEFTLVIKNTSDYYSDSLLGHLKVTVYHETTGEVINLMELDHLFGKNHITPPENFCYEQVCENDELKLQMRNEINDWIHMTNGCNEFVCNNESGKGVNNKCNDNEVCVNEECEQEVVNSEEWTVDVIINVSDMEITEMNTTEILNSLYVLVETNSSEIEESLKIILKMDENKQVHMILTVNDERKAFIISEKMEKCANPNNASQTREESGCGGVFRHIVSVQVQQRELFISSSNQYKAVPVIVIAILIIFISALPTMK